MSIIALSLFNIILYANNQIAANVAAIFQKDREAHAFHIETSIE